MGDHDARLTPTRPARECLELREDVALCDGVDRRSGLVTEQDGGIPEERAPDSDALLLATGQLETALAHDRLVAMRHAQDGLVQLRLLGRSDHLLV